VDDESPTLLQESALISNTKSETVMVRFPPAGCPEPSSLPLLITGIQNCEAVLFKKKKKKSPRLSISKSILVKLAMHPQKST
jgi:hypothetical protein